MYEQQLLKKLAEYFVAEEDVQPTKLLYRNGELTVYNGGIEMIPKDKVVQYRREKGNVTIDILNEIPPLVEYFGEEWLEKNGYTATRLYILFDLANQLKEMGKTSHKLNDIRNWVNMIISEAVLMQSYKSDWTPPPHYFNEAAGEAIKLLGS